MSCPTVEICKILPKMDFHWTSCQMDFRLSTELIEKFRNCKHFCKDVANPSSSVVPGGRGMHATLQFEPGWLAGTTNTESH